MDADPQNNQQQPIDGFVELGTSVSISLELLLTGRMLYSAQELRRAMGENTTVTTLAISFFPDYETQLADPSNFVQFILHYIRSRNHLRKLILQYAMPAAAEPLGLFIMAAAQSPSIRRLCLDGVNALPIQTVVVFWHENQNVKILEMRDVEVRDENQASALDVSTLTSVRTMCALDELILDRVTFYPTPALVFADIVPRLKIRTISLGRMPCIGVRGSDERTELRMRFLSNLVKSPAVKHLKLLPFCTSTAFNAALAAGNANVKKLSVRFSRFETAEEKIDSLAGSILDMAKVKVLRLVFPNRRVPILQNSKARLIRAVDACTTLTEIHVFDEGNNFTPEEVQLLRDGRCERNRALARLVANPDKFPSKEILKLMLQLENSPTGRFQLARAMPAALCRRGGAQTESTNNFQTKNGKEWNI